MRAQIAAYWWLLNDIVLADTMSVSMGSPLVPSVPSAAGYILSRFGKPLQQQCPCTAKMSGDLTQFLFQDISDRCSGICRCSTVNILQQYIIQYNCYYYYYYVLRMERNWSRDPLCFANSNNVASIGLVLLLARATE